VNKVKGVAIAVLVFGIISCLGFLVPGQWWGGLGGLLAVIGASVLLCCSGSGASASAGSHIGAGVLIASAAIVHAVAVIVYIVFWANVVNAVNDNCDDGVYSNPDDPNNQDEVDCDALSGVASAFIGVLIWPIIVIDIATFCVELICAIFSFQAAQAVRAQALPTTAGVPVAKPV